MSTSEVSISDVGVGPGAAEGVAAAPRAVALPTPVSSGVVAVEVMFVAALVAGLTALLAPRDLGAGLAPHPAWIAVILLSARYGSRGFGLSLGAVSAALTLTALCKGLGVGLFVTAASNSVGDLAALVLSVLVAWIASAHERRISELATCRSELAQKSADDGAVMAESRDAMVALRARADRLDHSLTFIRDVAGRLEGGDALGSAQAALELAIARTGARAGVVQLVEQRGLRTVASLGAWTLQRARPLQVLFDRTIKAAFDSAAPARAVDLPEAGGDDSDVATPVTDEAGDVLGVLALRGVPADSLCHALVHDLGLIARWCAKACAVPALVIGAVSPGLAVADGPAATQDEASLVQSSRFN
jgi:hypothetical protein